MIQKRNPQIALILSSSLLVVAATQLAVAAPMHIVAYGDSGVYGKGVARNETYPAQLETMLRQKGYDVTVTNDGVNGRTSEEAVANVGSVGRADVVIVQVGVNDAKHGVPAATIRKNVDTVIEKLKANGAAVLVVSYPFGQRLRCRVIQGRAVRDVGRFARGPISRARRSAKPFQCRGSSRDGVENVPGA